MSADSGDRPLSTDWRRALVHHINCATTDGDGRFHLYAEEGRNLLAEFDKLTSARDRLAAREEAFFEALRRARRWARDGGRSWTDLEWESELEALRRAVKRAPSKRIARAGGDPGRCASSESTK